MCGPDHGSTDKVDHGSVVGADLSGLKMKSKHLSLPDVEPNSGVIV